MRKGNLKRMAFVLTGIIVLFIAPLVVFAAIYSSKEKVNQFAPAQAKVQIEEKNNSAETQVQSFTFPATTDASGNYGVEKVAAVTAAVFGEVQQLVVLVKKCVDLFFLVAVAQ